MDEVKPLFVDKEYLCNTPLLYDGAEFVEVVLASDHEAALAAVREECAKELLERFTIPISTDATVDTREDEVWNDKIRKIAAAIRGR